MAVEESLAFLMHLPLHETLSIIQPLEPFEKLHLCSETQISQEWCSEHIKEIFTGDDYIGIGHIIVNGMGEMSYDMFSFIFSFPNELLRINSYYFRENPGFARELTSKLLEGEMGHPALDIGEWISVHGVLFPKNILGKLMVEFLGLERLDVVEELSSYYSLSKVLGMRELYELDNFDRVVEYIGENFDISFTEPNVKLYVKHAVDAGKEEFLVQLLNIGGDVEDVVLEELGVAARNHLISEDLMEYIIEKFSRLSTPTFEEETLFESDDVDDITRALRNLELE